MSTLPADRTPLGQARERPPRLTSGVEEVAVVLGLSRSKTYELVASGATPVIPSVGRRKLIARVTVDQLLAGERLKPGG